MVQENQVIAACSRGMTASAGEQVLQGPKQLPISWFEIPVIILI